MMQIGSKYNIIEELIKKSSLITAIILHISKRDIEFPLILKFNFE